MTDDRIPFPIALAALAAAGEETRLRILALLAEAELTVSELVAILGQSQPRVSRHLKLLVEGGLAQRRREGAWAFFRLAQAGSSADLARSVIARLDPTDGQLAADQARLGDIRRQRTEHAARYFAAHAPFWDRVRALHAPEALVERAVLEVTGAHAMGRVLDCGTGAGRMIELLARQAEQVIGVDLSPAMLAVARANLERAGVRNALLRQGDIYALPVAANSCDLAIVHQVLHYLDDPARALREAARALVPGGRLLIVDFAPHDQEFLREAHAHRRLGFSSTEIEDLVDACGLDIIKHRHLSPPHDQSGKLTVSIWLAQDRRIQTDVAPPRATEFA